MQRLICTMGIAECRHAREKQRFNAGQKSLSRLSRFRYVLQKISNRKNTRNLT